MPFKLGWVKAHVNSDQPATKWNQQVDELARIRVLKAGDTPDREWY